ncbi:MAG: hypothetical protein AABX10_05165 [Nanoarchaeota archaeon]
MKKSLLTTGLIGLLSACSNNTDSPKTPSVYTINDIHIIYNSSRVTVADMNGDSRPDIIVNYENYRPNNEVKISVLYNLGDGKYSPELPK